jgi:O-antigen/teichoic acid export membrane protein
LLWLVIVIVRGVSLPLVILHGVIWVQNRVYIIYSIGILTSWIGLGAFYLGLTFGEDLLAYTWSIGLPALLTSALLIVALAFNSQGIRIRVEHIKRDVAGEIFGFSSAVFITTLVPQLSVASQSFIAARVCGLDATAVLGVNARIGLLLSGIAMRVFDAFVPRWAATYCHSGIEPVRSEYVLVTRLTLLVGCGSTILLLLCNRPFIEWWTRPDLFGGALLTLVVALSFLFQSLLRILTFPFMLIRELKILAWVLVCGLVLELFLQWILATYFGLVGLVSAVPIAGMLLVGWFAVAGYTRIIGASWFHVFSKDALWYLPSLFIALLVCLLWSPVGGAFAQLIMLASVAFILILPIGWKIYMLGHSLLLNK